MYLLIDHLNKYTPEQIKSFESLIINRRCVDDTIELGNLKLIIAIAYPETKDYNVTNIDYLKNYFDIPFVTLTHNTNWNYNDIVDVNDFNRIKSNINEIAKIFDYETTIKTSTKINQVFNFQVANDIETYVDINIELIHAYLDDLNYINEKQYFWFLS